MSASAESHGNDSLLVIEAGRSERQYWRDIWRYRELFYFLAWRDLLVRYKQTVIGVAWAVLRPTIQMLILTVIFGRLAKLPAEGVPYPILVFVGLLPWNFFANGLSDASQSLVTNRNLISKIYFPRLIVPASSLVVGLVDFAISCVLLGVLMAWYQYVPGWRIVFIPPLLLIAMGAAIGAGLWFSALNVRYRDIRILIPFVVQFGLYISPVGFESGIVPEEWRLLYSINPMVGVLDGFRWALLGDGRELYLPGLVISLVFVAALMVTGLMYFRSVERTFADVI